jgi:hypothetical protein
MKRNTLMLRNKKGITPVPEGESRFEKTNEKSGKDEVWFWHEWKTKAPIFRIGAFKI